ncbi:MAG: helicase C-terminal domain-containing protein [Candidatus Izemoplasmatales bacterium]|nr:helicase C-terminal domain-containing protein [Candidatus Izemoplasmatales bacterium]
MKDIRVSAKEIAELLYGSGNIASESSLSLRAEEGQAIHKYWQDKYLETDQKEVYVAKTQERDGFRLEVTGRIDGIIQREGELMLEEIKSTHMDLELLDEKTFPAHLVQAKLYAHLYACTNNLSRLTVVLTYIDVETKDVWQYEKNFSKKVLENFFDKTIAKYIEWVNKIAEHESSRQKSIEGLSFPFPDYRLNQREMMAHVYRNILDKGILYIQAPTGIGKTSATLFAALKAIKSPKEKVFYLTAKNDGKQIAIDTISLLEENGLIAKTCEITAKDHSCLLKERDCDPDVCKYANGYYKRVFKAIRDIFENESLLTRSVIREYGKKHRVCPFEFSLDLSNYCDILIGDYNYAFDPRVRLIRYFEEKIADPILLVDEAHNLVARGREMYSASLDKEQIQKLLELTKPLKPSPKREIMRILDLFEELDFELINVDFVKYEEPNAYLIQLARRLLVKLDQVLTTDKKVPNRSQIMDGYFALSQFVRTSELYHTDFVFLLEHADNTIKASIKCLDASGFILQALKETALATVFFSATLDPIEYYQTLLTKNEGRSVKMTSPFRQENLLLLTVDTISTRYQDRKDSLAEIVEIARRLIEGKKGNYIMFFPSYEYLRLIETELSFKGDVEFIRQTREMTRQLRSETIMMFKNETTKTQVGLFVMGGVFAESIDLIGDMLSGVMIIGVGLPGLSPFNNILRSHFDEKFHQGFDYAYTYPGLNKVIQAVGRVIRTKTDRGVAVLVDDRFASPKYLRLYPREWSHMRVVKDMKELKSTINSFWTKTHPDNDF